MLINQLALLHLPHLTEKRELFGSLTVQAFGISMVHVFLPIYVMQLGYDFRTMCLLFVAQNLARFVFHGLSMKAIKLFGVKHSLAIGYLLSIGGFVAVSFASAYPGMLLVGLLLVALGDDFYWNPRHVMCAQLFRKRTAGRSVSTALILVHMAAALGPLAGGLLGERYGMSVTLAVAAGAIMLACVFLFATRDLALQRKTTKATSGRRVIPRQHMVAQMAHNFQLRSATLLWPLFVFMIVDNLSTIGLLFAVGLLATVVVTRIAGVLSDRGFERPLVILGSYGEVVAFAAKMVAATLGGAYFATLLHTGISSLKTAPYAAVLYKNARDYGVYDYIKTVQLAAVVGNTLMWLVAFGLAFVLEPRWAIVGVFVGAAIVSPLQTLITQAPARSLRRIWKTA